MDIANYIGLFLLKNNFCYLHGLGNLELRKKPATHSGDSLQGPQYEVVLTPTGSIDDNLANFIATNEQISISKAANALRDFSTQSRAELQAGKEVPIPGLGKFVADSNHVTRFVTDPHLSYTPPVIPALRMAKRTEEEPTFVQREHSAPVSDETGAAGPKVNWGKIILLVVIIGGLAAAAIFGIRYLNEHASTEAGNEAPVRDTVPAVTAPVADSTATLPADSAATPAGTGVQTTADGQLSYKVLLNTYATEAKAQRRVQQLTKMGRTVEMVAVDSTRYVVVMPVTGPAADTARVVDSLGRLYGNSGKASIFQ